MKASHTLAQPRTLHEIAAVFQHREVDTCMPESLLASLPHHEEHFLLKCLKKKKSLSMESMSEQVVIFQPPAKKDEASFFLL